MEKCKVIGLTGQTGAGKTLVGSLLTQQKYAVIDCDQVSRDVVSTGTGCLAELAAAFGVQILRPDGTLDRRKLGDIVFADREKRMRLNSIIFPHIHAAIDRDIERLEREGYPAVFLDAPTLFESGADARCDYVVSVIAPREIRRERILAREPDLTLEQADRRIAAQHDDAFYVGRSHFIIQNDAGQEELLTQIGEMLFALRLVPPREVID